MKPGYYVDGDNDLWIVYPNGEKEYPAVTFNGWAKWRLGDELLSRLELVFLGDL